MATEASTERAPVVFAVKEFTDGTPWIMLEPGNGKLGVLGNGFLGLDFREGVTFEQAQRFAEELRNMVESVSYTRFHDGT